jgi:hypothetical protein
MHRQLFAIFVLGALSVGTAFGQTPYAGLQGRPIKALSELQIADLQAGRGMALPAELNGYPGPSHLLELADRIGLSDAQRRDIQSMFDAMKSEAIGIGEHLVAQEAALGALFAKHSATPEAISVATAEIGATQGKLRAAHLKYHLMTVGTLQPSQIEQYAQLRGYAGESTLHHHPR